MCCDQLTGAARVATKEKTAPFEGGSGNKTGWGSALAGLEPRLGLVDDIDSALAAHNAAIAVTLLERAKRVPDLHGLLSSFAARRAPWVYVSARPDSEFMVGGTGIEPVATTMST